MVRTAIRFVLLGALVVALGGCSSVTYMSDRDTQVDFSAFDSFAWFELPAKVKRERPQPTPNDIVAGRIQRAVKAELAHRGLVSAPAAEADLLVTYDIALQHGMRVYHAGWAYPYRGCWWGPGPWGGAYHSARVVTRGTLILDVIDGSTRRLVWRGVAEGAFSQPNPSDQKVAEIVGKMMLSFPAG